MLQFVAVEGWFAASRPPLPRRRGTWEQPQPSSSRLLVRHAAPRLTLEDSHAKLVLVRHGQSEWNRANLFTGWVDVDLTEKGINEARKAGKLLQVEGFLFDKCYTSYLRRAIRSSCSTPSMRMTASCACMRSVSADWTRESASLSCAACSLSISAPMAARRRESEDMVTL